MKQFPLKSTQYANPNLSTRKCPIELKLYDVTNFDMGFRKNNITSRNTNVDF